MSNDVKEESVADLSNDGSANGVYDGLSNRAKEVAPQIERLLNGLNIDECFYLFKVMRRKIEDTSKVQLLV